MNFKEDKYMKLLAYILFRCSHKRNIGKTVISNLLYFIDFNYYELHQKTITNETYLKTKKGIKSEHFDKITSYLINKDWLVHRKEDYYNTRINRYYLIKIPSVKFSKDELEVIDNVIYNLSDLSATKIHQYASQDMPYQAANLGEEINQTYVFYRLSDYSAKTMSLEDKMKDDFLLNGFLQEDVSLFNEEMKLINAE